MPSTGASQVVLAYAAGAISSSRNASATAGVASRRSAISAQERHGGSPTTQHGHEPNHVVLAVHQHDLHGQCRGERARDERDPPQSLASCPRASLANATAPAPAIAPVPGASAET